MFKKDNLSLGILLGLITPIVAFFLYYFFVIRPHDVGLDKFFGILKDNKHMIPKITSICLLLNGLVFFLYTRSRKDVTAKGIFLVTMLYAIGILLLKLIR
ncbi:MAG TPA: hypothetical protein VM802_31805 [Chitinophaga sp.]|uniref:hypothetical protein n=1 Tax=Chitinophaga sp. TaxID=1869181 RepID=UPI002BD74425|nr:hypothetical protein [Chitinophaga sp.]HVI49495.1 hypothetical protein [Chitinophaga sp.]